MDEFHPQSDDSEQKYDKLLRIHEDSEHKSDTFVTEDDKTLPFPNKSHQNTISKTQNNATDYHNQYDFIQKKSNPKISSTQQISPRRRQLQSKKANRQFSKSLVLPNFQNEPLFNDVPFSQAPLDPSIDHFVFSENKSPRMAITARSIRSPSSPSESRYAKMAKMPYFDPIFPPHKIIRPNRFSYSSPISPRTPRHFQHTSNEINSEEKGQTNIQNGVVVKSGISGNCISTFSLKEVRIPSFKPPPPPQTDYLERNAASQRREKIELGKVNDRYKRIHPMPFYSKQYNPYVLETKEKMRTQEMEEYNRYIQSQRRTRNAEKKDRDELMSKMRNYERQYQ